MEFRERDHFLALKVMRLTKPSLYTTFPIPCEEQDLPRNTFKDAMKTDVGTVANLGTFGTGELLVLPQSFGNIFLGETFSSYISVHNDSTLTTKDIVIKTDLQTASQRLNLTGTLASPVPTLTPKESIDQVINHEVKELGAHILVCAVSYTTSTGEKLYFRKFYKFQVLKPLDVKTKFYNAEDDELYLEAQVQNITSSPMVMESVSLEPSPLYNVSDLNIRPDKNNDSNKEGFVDEFDSWPYLSPNDTRQYLYKLTPKNPQGMEKQAKSVATIGKLDIVWKTSMGERGRLQTSQLQRVVPAIMDVKMTVLEIPDVVQVEKRFCIKFKLLNTCDRKMELKLLMTKTKDGGILWCGTSGKNLGPLPPGSNLELQLNLLPLSTGLQTVGGLRIMDVVSSKTYDFDSISKVFVHASDESPFNYP